MKLGPFWGEIIYGFYLVAVYHGVTGIFDTFARKNYIHWYSRLWYTNKRKLFYFMYGC